MKRLLIPLLLAGCQTDPGYLVNQQTPPVRAYNGGSAELTLDACMIPGNAKAVETALQALITSLQSAGVLVTANGGTARLNINLCQP